MAAKAILIPRGSPQYLLTGGVKNQSSHRCIFRADEIIRHHAEKVGYDLEGDTSQDFKWDRAISDELETLQEEAQFWNMSQAEYDRLAGKALGYVRAHREHFTN